MSAAFSARGGFAPRDPEREEGKLIRSREDLLRSEGVDPEGFGLRPNVAIWKKTKDYSLPLMEIGSGAAPLTDEEIDRILGEPLPPPPPPAEETILVVPMGDLQIGKIDGTGTPGTIARYRACISGVRDRILRDHDGVVHTLVLPQLGDIIEGCVSQGGKLATRLDTPVSQQVTLGRRLLIEGIKFLAPHGYNVVVPAVAGNHDEVGRQFATDPTDSWALDIARGAMDALEGRPGFEHVRFEFQEKGRRALSVVVGEQHPMKIGMTHGDVMRNQNMLIEKYYPRQLANRKSPLYEADILLNGHFHNWTSKGFLDNRYWIQIPPLDGGSEWWREITGDECTSGMLSFLVTPDARHPINRIEFH